MFCMLVLASIIRLLSEYMYMTSDFSETIVAYDLKLATDDWSDKKYL